MVNETDAVSLPRLLSVPRMVQALAVGGFLAGRKPAPESAGTFPVTTPLFVALLVAVILVVGALTFFPALSLGPIVEHLLMGAGRTF